MKKYFFFSLPKTAQEINILHTQNNLSRLVFGKISPYPTEIIVTTVK